MEKNEEKKKDDIHIGKLVKAQVTKKGIRVSWLAEQLHCHRNNIYKMYEKQWIDTHLLFISHPSDPYHPVGRYTFPYEEIWVSR